MAEHRWRDLLPEIVRSHPRPVADPGTREHWEQAIATLTRAEEISLLLVDEMCDCRRASCTSCFSLPVAEWTARANTLIEGNREALQHFRDGITLGCFRSPVAPPDMDSGFALLRELRSLTLLAKIEALRQAEQGQPFAAARTLAEIIAAGRLLLDSEGTVVDYLVGIALIGVGAYAVDELLDRHRMSVESLAQLAATLDQLAISQSLVNILRSELNRGTLPTLEHFEQLWQLRGPSAFFEVFNPDPNGQHAWREQQLQALLVDHPHAFDVDELARGLACRVAVDVSECENRSLGDEVLALHASFQQRIKRFNAIWPTEFVQPLCSVGEGAFAEDPEMQDILRTHNESIQPLSDDRLRSVRESLREITNPLGMAVYGQVAGLGPRTLLGLPLSALLEALRHRLDLLRHPTLRSRGRELVRRWRRRRADRLRLRKRNNRDRSCESASRPPAEEGSGNDNR